MADLDTYTALLEGISNTPGQDELIVSRRFMDESRELRDAIVQSRRAEILDEFANVTFFVMRH